MQRTLEVTVEYAKTRKQFGKPIGNFQAVQQHCADMCVQTESSRSAAYYAAYAVQKRAGARYCSVGGQGLCQRRVHAKVGNRGIQVHGGMGFTWENDVHLYYRRAKASETMLGDAAYHRERIARQIIDQASSGKKPTSKASSAGVKIIWRSHSVRSLVDGAEMACCSSAKAALKKTIIIDLGL